ncbi:MAG TPA: 16S rRNA (guanine(527)-N(7))-methyltransferase RsmG [Caulobacteraceae bacterium]|jgi:16S rRNA (guanine527-N7)-methyltransferase|nr:16S rRNA (guanine(527)-N(7))-methyltransferase RsmG [Caulobacteraceae bacterium]
MPAAPALLDDMAEAPAEAFGAAEFAAATGATPAQMADLQVFRANLADWNTRMNLVGPSALAEFWLRHAYDSAQLLPLEPQALRWADLGAGAGFPGLVLAVLLKGRPGAQVHLVESMAKRCRFLEDVVASLSLPATVHHARAEDLDISVDVVTARACAPLVRLFGYARPYLKRGAIGLFMKGQDVVAELEAATRSWRFEAELIDSLSHTDGRIVRMRKLKHV